MGKILVLLAAIFWAGCGTVAQYLFAHSDILPKELTVFRMLTAGSILLLISFIPKFRPKNICLSWRDKFLRLPFFGIVGIYLMQYTYFESIYWGGAAAATVLQYTAPIMIISYTSLSARKCPNITETIATISAVVGVFLLVSGGDFTRLLVPPNAIIWGLVSAVALAVYTVYPRNLLGKLPAHLLLGIGMLMGGVVGLLISGDIEWQKFFIIRNLRLVSFIILFGTVLPFFMYLQALKVLSPTTVGVLACVEPFAVVVFSIVFLKMSFGIGEILGILAVVAAVILISTSKEVKA